jgi:3'(2'), 5'-bisphosphate nucleotidase
LRAADAGVLRSRVVEWVTQMLGREVSDSEQVLAWIDRGAGQCGDRFWTLDPIDGTKGLLRGSQYVIALALVVNGRVEVAVVGCPRLSVTTGPPSPSGPADLQAPAVMMPVKDHAEGGVAVAVRERGAWWMSLREGSLMRLSVSAETKPARARALHSYEPGHADIAPVHRVLRGLGVQGSPILMDSQAKHVLLAAGTAELLLRFPIDRAYHDAIWDHAPGSLLIEEAGGRVTDVEGRRLDFTTGRRLVRNTGLVASNGLLHETVLEMIGTGSWQ